MEPLLPEVITVARLADKARAETTAGQVGPAWNYVSMICEQEFPEVLGALARSTPQVMVPLLRGLDKLRRGPESLLESSALRQAAAKLIKALTGTERHSVFDTWMAERENAPRA